MIKLQCDTMEIDRYNRYIGVCYKNNIDLNSQMVINGWAIAYKYYSLDYEKEEKMPSQKKWGSGLENLKILICLENKINTNHDVVDLLNNLIFLIIVSFSSTKDFNSLFISRISIFFVLIH